MNKQLASCLHSTLFAFAVAATCSAASRSDPASTFASSAAHVSKAEASRWIEDLNYLAAALVRFHPNAFHIIARADFDRHVGQLRENIPRLNRTGIIVGLASIAALVHDAHTGFGLGGAPPVSFHYYPIKLYQYSDGVFVQASEPKYADLLGAEVLGIGGVPIDEVLARFRTVASSSNEWTFRSQLGFLLKGEIVQALGLSDSPSHATLRLKTAAGSKDVRLDVIRRPFSAGYSFGPPAATNWIDARAAGDTPLYLQHQTEKFWYVYLPTTRMLYVQCNAVLNSDDESLQSFFARVFDVADREIVDKFVLDLRLNGGGDNALLSNIVPNIARRKNINTFGKFFVVIGRDTQSAAENFVDRLQRDTHAIFVGEPTGERPNMYGDPWPFVLPNSRIEVNIASLQWEDIDPRDDRDWTGPDLAAELSSTDYARNVDPAMAVIAKATFVPLRATLVPALASDDPDLIKKAYDDYFADPLHEFTQTDGAIESLTKDLLASRRFAVALPLLAWNSDRTPTSIRALDLLCDGL